MYDIIIFHAGQRIFKGLKDGNWSQLPKVTVFRDAKGFPIKLKVGTRNYDFVKVSPKGNTVYRTISVVEERSL